MAKLPKAYCYATAENGRIHARLNLGGETYRGVWLNYEGDEVATVPGPCELRTRWVNPQLAVLGKALVRPDGKVVQNGEQPVRYESVKRVEPETGLVIVTADSQYAGSSPEETQRLAAAPDIPTMVEQGMPGYLVEGWFGFIGPKGLPAADVKRLHDAVTAAFAAPEVREAMGKQGNTISISTTEYAQQFFRSEMAKYAKLVKKAGIELQ